MRKIIYIFFVFILIISFNSCTKDEFGASIFDTTDYALDPNSPTYTFDIYLRENYLLPYNLDFQYKMLDVGSDVNYNLIPTQYEKSILMAKLVKYLWFDAYAAVVSPDFLKRYGPRIIHLIGSPAYNPQNGTMVLGTAEGGIKVTLYRCNELPLKLDNNMADLLNEYYFKTMHHEFAHILHQQKSYPPDFKDFSKGKYDALGWQNITLSEAATLGFVSPYARSSDREDFVEIIANYLVKSDADWNHILFLASQPGVDRAGNVLKDDGIDGDLLILSKKEMAAKWLKEKWNIDIEVLREEIKTRQENISSVDLNID